MESTAIAQGRNMVRESLRPVVPTFKPCRIRPIEEIAAPNNPTRVPKTLSRLGVRACDPRKPQIVASAQRICVDPPL